MAGRLDEARLQTALGWALAAHPMARARKAASSGRAHQYSWEISDVIEVDPLRTVDCANDAAVAAARETLQGLAVPLAESPPFRARLVRNTGGDLLMLNANHAATDAFGALQILRSVADAYCDGAVPPVGPSSDPIEARERLGELTDADRGTRARRRLALADKVTDLIVRPARIVAEGASGETSRCRPASPPTAATGDARNQPSGRSRRRPSA